MKTILGFLAVAALFAGCGGPIDGDLSADEEVAEAVESTRTAQALPTCWAPLTYLGYKCLDGSGIKISDPYGTCGSQGYRYQFSPCEKFKDARGYLGRNYCSSYVYWCTLPPASARCVKQCQ